MKNIEEMTFQEMVEWAEGHILKELIAGKFHNGVWSVCDMATRWHQKQMADAIAAERKKLKKAS